jgi:enoyl-CoA hydratase/carnithine racemase
LELSTPVIHHSGGQERKETKMPATAPVIKVEYLGRIAILTIDNPTKLNALSGAQYYELAQRMQEVAEHDEVYITIIIGKGRFFSAYVTLERLYRNN